MPAFASILDRPQQAQGYPLTLAVALGPDVRQAVYFERIYLSAQGTELAVRATLIEARGFVLLHETGEPPVGTATIEASLTNQNRATEPDPAREVTEATTEPAKFATALERPVLFDGDPLYLSLAIGNTRQTVYLERVYMGAFGNEIAIRSDAVYGRNMLAGFNIHQPEPPLGTRHILTSLTNQYRATVEAGTLEYEHLEWNNLEYN